MEMEIKFYLMKIKFEIKEEQGNKAIFIDNELFDWGIEENALEQANQYASNDEILKAIHTDIREYFLDCIEQYLNFRPTIKQINKSLKVGYIEND